MSVEDPFDQVLEDTREQLTRLTNYLTSHQIDNEIIDIVKDVQETIDDLERSLVVMKRNQMDTESREANLQQIKLEVERLIKDYKINTKISAEEGIIHQEDNNIPGQPTSIPDQEPPSSLPDTNPTVDGLQEQMLQEQDVHLDNIHQTMQNLHLQAQTMGQELEDQGQLLDDLDTNFDSVTNKLNRSRRQLEWVYEKNKEKVNDCCILLLIIALIVLLVLAFLA